MWSLACARFLDHKAAKAPRPEQPVAPVRLPVSRGRKIGQWSRRGRRPGQAAERRKQPSQAQAAQEAGHAMCPLVVSRVSLGERRCVSPISDSIRAVHDDWMGHSGGVECGPAPHKPRWVRGLDACQTATATRRHGKSAGLTAPAPRATAAASTTRRTDENMMSGKAFKRPPAKLTYPLFRSRMDD